MRPKGHAPGARVDADVERLEEGGRTTMAISLGGEFLGVIALADQPRPGVRQTLQALLDSACRNWSCSRATTKRWPQRIGKAVGVTDVRANLLPEDKLNTIKALEAEHGAIAMIGDGVNDAPALATATVGSPWAARGRPWRWKPPTWR